MNNLSPDVDIEFQDEFAYQDYLYQIPDDLDYESDKSLAEQETELNKGLI